MRATLSRGSPSSGHVCSARCPGNQQWGARTYKERDRECVGLLILTAVPSVVIYTVREYQTFVDGTDSCQIERQTERELLTSFLVYTTLGSTVGSSSLLCRTATHCNTLQYTATHCSLFFVHTTSSHQFGGKKRLMTGSQVYTIREVGGWGRVPFPRI